MKGRVGWVTHTRRNRNGYAREDDATYKRGFEGLGTRDVELISVVYDNDRARLVSTKPRVTSIFGSKTHQFCC